MLEMALAVFRVYSQAVGDHRVELPTALADILCGNLGQWTRVVAFIIDQEDCMEDLRSVVCIHRQRDLADHTQVAVNEFDQPAGVIECAGAGTPGNVKLKVGQGISGDVLKTGKSELVNNVSLDARFVAGGLNIKSMLCAPLKWKGNTFGVINLSNSSEKLFNLEELF